ncbi:WecB/TagA/CpsF family glycosyltransferase [Patescibacteria group bacterium]
MRLNALKLLKINITTDRKETILEETRKYILENQKAKPQDSAETVKPFVITTPNPEQIVYASGDKQFGDILNKSDVTLPDGSGIVWGIKMLERKGQTVKLERIAGVDFMKSLINIASQEGFRIGFIGGKKNIAVKALDCLKKTDPTLSGWAQDGPTVEVVEDKNSKFETRNSKQNQSFDFAQDINSKSQIQNSDNIINEKINKIRLPKMKMAVDTYMFNLARKVSQEHTQVLFVGLGAPKQEYFIYEFTKAWDKVQNEIKPRFVPEVPLVHMEPLVIMAVGGSFDMIAGKVKRAPVSVQKAGFEWLWRLFHQPWRAKRQLSLLKFIFLVLKDKFIHR